ncbi:MAG: hypothetical protein HPY90_01375 [Syntrophothermus sp.]|nr:hypothetical protein [Syntrophothermus sp.]
MGSVVVLALEVRLVKDRWKKGEPVNLSDLLKITPVANEILRLRDEMNLSCSDILWIVSEILDENENLQLGEAEEFCDSIDEDEELDDEDWDENDDEGLEADEGIDNAYCTIEVKIRSRGKFPEMGFKAGIRAREDLKPFLRMVLEMINRFGE